jgi:hypothetical protein
MGRRRLFKAVSVKRSELLAALRHARRDGSPEVTGENLATVLLTMEPDAITRLLDEIPRGDAIRLVDYVVIAEENLNNRHALRRSALARLGLLALASDGGAHG